MKVNDIMVKVVDYFIYFGSLNSEGKPNEKVNGRIYNNSNYYHTLKGILQNMRSQNNARQQPAK
jgi:hypothetical protein